MHVLHPSWAHPLQVCVAHPRTPIQPYRGTKISPTATRSPQITPKAPLTIPRTAASFRRVVYKIDFPKLPLPDIVLCALAQALRVRAVCLICLFDIGLSKAGHPSALIGAWQTSLTSSSLSCEVRAASSTQWTKSSIQHCTVPSCERILQEVCIKTSIKRPGNQCSIPQASHLGSGCSLSYTFISKYFNSVSSNFLPIRIAFFAISSHRIVELCLPRPKNRKPMF